MAPHNRSQSCTEGQGFSRQGLEAAISLLKLTTDRIQDETTAGLAVQETQNTTGASEAPASLEEGEDARTNSVSSNSNDGEDGIEELDETDDYDDGEIVLLVNKVLDRLAEVLSRFKSDTLSRKSKKLGPSHVSSILMIYPKDKRPTKILCSKNEGLDNKDEAFIKNWANCMEAIALNGKPAKLRERYEKNFLGGMNTDHRNALLDLVFDHQQPRIHLYIQQLKNARKATSKPILPAEKGRNTRFKEALAKIAPRMKIKWIDNFGLKYEILTRTSSNHSHFTISTDQLYLQNPHPVMETLFKDIHQLCTKSLTQEDESLLAKRVSGAIYENWKDVKSRVRVKFETYR